MDPAQREAFLETSWREVSLPGAYVEKGTGDLYRFPKEAVLPGGSPLIEKQSAGASRLVRISADPYIITEKARMLCAEHNIRPNF